MKPFVTQMSDVSTGRTKWRRRRYQIAEAFADYFPPTEFPDYGAFLTAGGDAMKRERRTRVAIIRRGRRGVPADGISSFVLKVYRYPFIQGIRTGFQISKAQREFDSLRYLNRIGVGAAQAVGYGAERTSLGFVRSCFIITRFVDDSIDLSQWYAEAIHQEEVAGKKIDELFTQLGRMFRRLHQEKFFLFTAKPKNILVRNCRNHAEELVLIDIPYARTLKWRLLARWAQARDIAVLFGNVTGPLSDTATELFYRAYLPDPLGFPSDTVRRRALRQLRARQHQTLISRWTHHLKRRLSGKARPSSVS